MKALNFIWVLIALTLTGCGGPVPSGVYLTLSVTVRDVAVITAINGEEDAFLSGDSGAMTGSRPINALVRQGENEATFTLNAIDAKEGQPLDPAILAILEISLKGQTIDTLAPGANVFFSRELTEAEYADLLAGETVTITERFTVDKAALQAIKNVD